jgi:hypothetical protein
MPAFTKNKVTTSVIFYNRGVPAVDKNFAFRATLNYSILKQLAIYNKNNGKSQFSLF